MSNNNFYKAFEGVRRGTRELMQELTNFMCWFVTGVRHWVTFSPTSRPRRVIKFLLYSLISTVSKKKFLRDNALMILSHFPRLKHRLKQIKSTNHIINHQIPLEINHLSARQRDIFMLIKNSKNRSNKT